MKTIVDAKPFSDALANACTVPRKSRIPCLNEVYVHASRTVTEFSAFCLNVFSML